MSIVHVVVFHIDESFLVLHETLYKTLRFETEITYVDIFKLTVDMFWLYHPSQRKLIIAGGT